MSILFLIIPFALLIALIFIIAFSYAVKKGQFEDLDTPAYRMLTDDEDTNGVKK